MQAFVFNMGTDTHATQNPPALQVKEDLSRARDGFVMSSDLHLTFLVTPVTEELRINWARFDALFGRLPEVERRIAGLVGVVSGGGAAERAGGLGLRRGWGSTLMQEQKLLMNQGQGHCGTA